VVAVLICLSACFVYYLLKRTRAMAKLTKVDAASVGDMEMFPDIDAKAEAKQTPRLGHEVACGPLEELDEERRKQVEYERELLKGKSIIDKKRLLTDL